MFLVVVDDLPGENHFRRRPVIPARVQISHIARKIAARNLQSDSVSGLEGVAGLPQVYRVLVNRPRLN
jgi:hypothetical protein